jgi:hypothetical protein
MEMEILVDSLRGPGGELRLPNDDVARKLLMLIEGECGGCGRAAAAAKFSYSRQRYFQLRSVLEEKGIAGLISQKRGPRTRHRRTAEVVCQVVRHRFLDPEASSAVIAQKMQQAGLMISRASVDRIVAEFGLQKKTLRVAARPHAR